MKIKVGLFIGGNSVEHEISVITGLQAAEYIDKEKYEIIPIYITKDNRFFTGEAVGKIESYRNIPSLLKNATEVLLAKGAHGTVELIRREPKLFGINNIVATFDIALPAVHGTNCEDGTLQGLLTLLDVPYAGCDVYASALGMDKYAMKAVLVYNGIPVLDGVLCNIFEFSRDAETVITKLEEQIGYPMIVKPYNLGSSVGISKAADRKKLVRALENGFVYAQSLLVEHAITNLKEINCAVLGDKERAEASECEEPISSDEILSYQDKYISGGKAGKTGGKTGGSKGNGMASLKRKIPAEIDDAEREEVRNLAVKAFGVLGCAGIARIDFMKDLDTGKIYLNEINTIPGSLAFYLWTPLGVSYTELLDRIITLAVKRKRENESTTHSFDTNVLAGVSFGTIGGKA